MYIMLTKTAKKENGSLSFLEAMTALIKTELHLMRACLIKSHFQSKMRQIFIMQIKLHVDSISKTPVHVNSSLLLYF